MTEPEWDDELQCFIVKRTQHWVVGVTPMIYNDRVVLMKPDEMRTGYTAGFCYDKGGAALIAAVVWDPDTQDRPAGWKKIACDARFPLSVTNELNAEVGMR